MVCPSVAAGRGVGGSTAASHSSGATVRMDAAAEMFLALQDTTALTGLHTQNTERGFDHVASGCVWTADSAGSTRAASMTSGVAYINGRRHTVSAVTARTFTASKDTYVDLLYSTVDNVATVVYTEVTNNAASPALAANSIRIGIVVTGATTIAAAASINQGQEDRILPIASSIAYTFTDSLGNIICPRDSQRKVLGYRQITTAFATTNNGATAITGLSVPVIVPTGRKVKITLWSRSVANSSSGDYGIGYLYDTSTAGTELAESAAYIAAANANVPMTVEAIVTPSANSKTYVGAFSRSAAGTATLQAASTYPAFLKVELI